MYKQSWPTGRKDAHTQYSGSSLIRTALFLSWQKSVWISEFVRISEPIELLYTVQSLVQLL